MPAADGKAKTANCAWKDRAARDLKRCRLTAAMIAPTIISSNARNGDHLVRLVRHLDFPKHDAPARRKSRDRVYRLLAPYLGSGGAPCSIAMPRWPVYPHRRNLRHKVPRGRCGIEHREMSPG
jgi:hypothetical protein